VAISWDNRIAVLQTRGNILQNGIADADEGSYTVCSPAATPLYTCVPDNKGIMVSTFAVSGHLHNWSNQQSIY
jgi:hypothetical protein